MLYFEDSDFLQCKRCLHESIKAKTNYYIGVVSFKYVFISSFSAQF